MADAAALLDVMSGPFPGDPLLRTSARDEFSDGGADPSASLRVGFFTDPIIADVPVDRAPPPSSGRRRRCCPTRPIAVEPTPRPFGPEMMSQFEVLCMCWL